MVVSASAPDLELVACILRARCEDVPNLQGMSLLHSVHSGRHLDCHLVVSFVLIVSMIAGMDRRRSHYQEK